MLYCNLQVFFCTEITVEKHFDAPKCDFWRGLGGHKKISRLAIARLILRPLINYTVIRPLLSGCWLNNRHPVCKTCVINGSRLGDPGQPGEISWKIGILDKKTKVVKVEQYCVIKILPNWSNYQLLCSRKQTSDALSWVLSAFAIRDPNCIARFGSVAPFTSPSLVAASRNRNLSPTPRGMVKFAYTKQW